MPAVYNRSSEEGDDGGLDSVANTCPVEVGDCVRFRCRGMERLPGCPQFLLAVVIQEVTKDEWYMLGTRQGILREPRARTSFELLTKPYLTLKDVKSNRFYELKAADMRAYFMNR